METEIEGLRRQLDWLMRANSELKEENQSLKNEILDTQRDNKALLKALREEQKENRRHGNNF